MHLPIKNVYKLNFFLKGNVILAFIFFHVSKKYAALIKLVTLLKNYFTRSLRLQFQLKKDKNVRLRASFMLAIESPVHISICKILVFRHVFDALQAYFQNIPPKEN